jgi:hypothetical protein
VTEVAPSPTPTESPTEVAPSPTPTATPACVTTAMGCCRVGPTCLQGAGPDAAALSTSCTSLGGSFTPGSCGADTACPGLCSFDTGCCTFDENDPAPNTCAIVDSCAPSVAQPTVQSLCEQAGGTFTLGPCQ